MLFLVTGLATANQPVSGTNCYADEKVFFSCPIGSKAVSICKPSNRKSGDYLEYRFGTPTRIELRYKGTSKDSPRKFYRADITGANNSGTSLWFANQGTHYVLNAPVRGGPFLEVFKQGKRISRFGCKRKWAEVQGDLEDKSDAIEVKTQQQFYSEVLGLSGGGRN